MTPSTRLVLALALVSVTLPLAAQQRPQPQIVVSLYGGYDGGHQLWSVARQTLVYNGSTSNPPDTVALRRQLGSSLAVGVVFQVFRGPTWGGFAEFAFRPLGFDDTCAPVAPFQQDPPGTDVAHRNRTLCDNITSQVQRGSMVGLTLGAIVRAAPRAAITPYARAGATVTYVGARTREVAAPQDGTGFSRLVIQDESAEGVTLGVSGAVGLQLALSPGYQLRLEVRDRLVKLQTVAGAANATGNAPAGQESFHQLAVTIGFDVVLEQRRGRRY